MFNLTLSCALNESLREGRIDKERVPLLSRMISQMSENPDFHPIDEEEGSNEQIPSTSGRLGP